MQRIYENPERTSENRLSPRAYYIPRGRSEYRLLNGEWRFAFFPDDLTVTGRRPVAEAIITSGGVKVSEVDPKTMESKLVKNFYFAGEILDCDAYTGGFNLQIAWATAFSAGNAAAGKNRD